MNKPKCDGEQHQHLKVQLPEQSMGMLITLLKIRDKAS